eukprot:NODE_26880_length_214_cov_1.684848_g25710_i0.p1 GENE.NODE_26880_length_214_cov_1.684848_g25710_i0~~NODE_26880_length_214_cov_1.684848_g25710_i0.p1  ORF type:complete len:61 (+),score=8.12 NODE_26880_length_214_cov_1.684848_g25710_i0:2-184(+)
MGQLSQGELEGMNQDTFNDWKQSLVPCPRCNRTFRPDALKVDLCSFIHSFIGGIYGPGEP